MEATRLGVANCAQAVADFLLCAYVGFSLVPAAMGFLADAIGVVPALACFGAILLLAHAALAARRPRGSMRRGTEPASTRLLSLDVDMRLHPAEAPMWHNPADRA